MTKLHKDIIRVKNDYYIRAASALTDNRTRVIKHGETFCVFDLFGDFHPVGQSEQGLYHEGTRFRCRRSDAVGMFLRPPLQFHAATTR